MLRNLNGHSSYVYSTCFSRDGKYIVSASNDKSIKIWDKETCNLISTLNGHSSFVKSVGISYDSKYIVSGSADKTVKLWDKETCNLLEW